MNVDEQAATFECYQAERRLRANPSTGRERVRDQQLRSTLQPQRQAETSFASTAGGNGHNLKKALRNAGLFDLTHDETPALRSAWKSIVTDFAADNIGLTGTAVIKALGTFFKDAADREWWAQVSVGIGDLDMFLAQFDQYFEGPKRNRREAVNDIIRMRRTTDQTIDRFLLTVNGKIGQLRPPADDDERVDLVYDTLPECLRIGDLETRPSENTDAYTYISICTKLRRIEERVVVQTVRLAEEKARTNSKSLAVNLTLLNVTDPYIRAETLRRGGFTSTATTSDGASGSGKRSAVQQVTIDDDDELADPGSVCINVNNSRSSFSSQSSKPQPPQSKPEDKRAVFVQQIADAVAMGQSKATELAVQAITRAQAANASGAGNAAPDHQPRQSFVTGHGRGRGGDRGGGGAGRGGGAGARGAGRGGFGRGGYVPRGGGNQQHQQNVQREPQRQSWTGEFQAQFRPDMNNRCHCCLKTGHYRNECPTWAAIQAADTKPKTATVANPAVGN